MPELKTVKLWTARVGRFWGNYGYELWPFFDCGRREGLGTRDEGLGREGGSVAANWPDRVGLEIGVWSVGGG